MGRNSSSSEKQRVRILREICGVTQRELAEIFEISLRTLQKLEGGELQVSDRLAQVAEIKTGVSRDWLMGRETLEPIRSASEIEFDRSVFEMETKSFEEFRSHKMILRFISAQLEAIIVSAATRNRFIDVEEDIFRFISFMREKYGYDREHLVRSGNEAGIDLIASEIAREEARKRSSDLGSGELSALVSKAIDKWRFIRPSRKLRSLEEFRKQISDSVERVLQEEILRESAGDQAGTSADK